jgi:hypothetical protein
VTHKQYLVECLQSAADASKACEARTIAVYYKGDSEIPADAVITDPATMFARIQVPTENTETFELLMARGPAQWWKLVPPDTEGLFDALDAMDRTISQVIN